MALCSRWGAVLSLVLTLLPAAARAQAFEGLDLTQSGDDFTKGPPVVAAPPRKADKKADAELYRPLHAALKELLGNRLVAEDATLKVFAEQARRGVTGAVQIARAMDAAVVISVEVNGNQLVAKVEATDGQHPPVERTFTRSRKRVDVAQARGWMAPLLEASKALLLPAPEAEPAVVTKPYEPAPEDAIDVAAEAQGTKQAFRLPRSESGPIALALAGAGASFRSFSAEGSKGPLIPRAPNGMASLGVDVAIYPFRLVPALETSVLHDFSIEGAYRFSVVRAVLQDTATGERPCGATDDAILARAVYRFPLGGRLPRIGASVGYASERTQFRCEQPALDTHYEATEVHLQVLQPIFGEKLALQLSGGPRFMFSLHALGFPINGLSAEGWVTSRPFQSLYVRAGARWTRTVLTTWPDGLGVTDMRTFAGLEAGAAL